MTRHAREGGGMTDKDGRKLVSVTVEDATITSRLEGENYVIRLNYTIVRRWERPLSEPTP